MSEVSRRNVLKMVATTGLVVVAGGSTLADDKKAYDMWRSWAVTEGEQTKLVVEGIYSQGGPGVVVTVEERVPEGLNSGILLLDLKRALLPGSWPGIVGPVPACYTKVPYKKDQYKSVQVRYPNGSVVSIDWILDTRQGPLRVAAEQALAADSPVSSLYS